MLKKIVMFLYWITGLKAVVSKVESGLLRYRLRLNIVPTSYKVFISLVGMIIGATGMYVYLTFPTLLESHNIVTESIQAKVKDVEVKELTIEEKIAKAFPEAPEIMIAVAKAESSLNPKAMHTNTNGSIDIGLFQVNSVHGQDQLSLTDVDKNIAVARSIYDKQGLSAWSVVNNGSVNKFLK